MLFHFHLILHCSVLLSFLVGTAASKTKNKNSIYLANFQTKADYMKHVNPIKSQQSKVIIAAYNVTAFNCTNVHRAAHIKLEIHIILVRSQK